jgi:hypothetical protein
MDDYEIINVILNKMFEQTIITEKIKRKNTYSNYEYETELTYLNLDKFMSLIYNKGPNIYRDLFNEKLKRVTIFLISIIERMIKDIDSLGVNFMGESRVVETIHNYITSIEMILMKTFRETSFKYNIYMYENDAGVLKNNEIAIYIYDTNIPCKNVSVISCSNFNLSELNSLITSNTLSDIIQRHESDKEDEDEEDDDHEHENNEEIVELYRKGKPWYMILMLMTIKLYGPMPLYNLAYYPTKLDCDEKKYTFLYPKKDLTEVFKMVDYYKTPYMFRYIRRYSDFVGIMIDLVKVGYLKIDRGPIKRFDIVDIGHNLLENEIRKVVSSVKPLYLQGLFEFPDVNRDIYSQIVNPTIKYISFEDAGDNMSTNEFVTLLLELVDVHPYPDVKSKYMTVPFPTPIDVVYGNEETLGNIHDSAHYNTICIGRTIFNRIKVGNEDALIAYKIKKEKEDVVDLYQENRIISWLHKTMPNQFKYLIAKDPDVIYKMKTSTLAAHLVGDLEQQIKNSGNGYQLCTEGGEYKYIIYYIRALVGNFMDIFRKGMGEGQLYKSYFAQQKNTGLSITDTNCTNKDILQAINIPREAFTKYLESCFEEEGCTRAEFARVSIMNMTQAGFLVRKGLVHSSLVNMFHNSDDDRLFITMASILSLQSGREGTGRLSQIFQAAKFSNFRLIGIADFAEIIPLSDFENKIKKELDKMDTLGVKIHLLKTVANVENYVILESLMNQMLSWFIVLIHKIFITDAHGGNYYNNEVNADTTEYMTCLIHEIFSVYIMSYLNVDRKVVNKIFASAKFNNDTVRFIVNQAKYFLSMQYVNDIVSKRMPSNIYPSHIEVELPSIETKYIEYADELGDVDYPVVTKYKWGGETVEVAKYAEHYVPRGWIQIILTFNDKYIAHKDIGWFYYVSNANNSDLYKMFNDPKILIVTIAKEHEHEQNKKKNYINYVMDDIDKDAYDASPQLFSEKIYKSIYNKLYPYMDAGAVNGSLPFQSFIIAMHNVFSYAMVYKELASKGINYSDIGSYIGNIYSNDMRRLGSLVKSLYTLPSHVFGRCYSNITSSKGYLISKFYNDYSQTMDIITTCIFNTLVSYSVVDMKKVTDVPKILRYIDRILTLNTYTTYIGINHNIRCIKNKSIKWITEEYEKVKQYDHIKAYSFILLSYMTITKLLDLVTINYKPYYDKLEREYYIDILKSIQMKISILKVFMTHYNPDADRDDRIITYLFVNYQDKKAPEEETIDELIGTLNKYVVTIDKIIADEHEVVSFSH